MSRRANPTLIGAFVVGGIAIVLAAVIALGGDNIFSKRERVVMYFRGSIYGLQLGAPVVFRGVRLGSVSDIGIAFDQGTGAFYIPVTAQLERKAVRDIAGNDTGLGATFSIRQLVDRGLRAQLSMQSLVTGQLYVDFDFDPNKNGDLVSKDGTMPEVPTTATTIQQLRTQFEQLDLQKLAEDVSEIASSVRRLVAGPELEKGVNELRVTLSNLSHLTQRLDAQIDPLMASVRSTLGSADRSLKRIDEAAGSATGALRSADSAIKRLDATTSRLDTVIGNVGALTQPDGALVRNLQQTTEELARTAIALRDSVSTDSALQQNLNRSLADISRAARALRDLGDTLDRQPESLLRGRSATADR